MNWRTLAALLTLSAPFHAAEAAPCFLDESGTATCVSDWKGQTVILNLWATWCAPCRLELPQLNRLNEEFGEEGLKIAAVSVDKRDMKLLRKFYLHHGIELDLYQDASLEIMNDLDTKGIPFTVIYNKNGEPVERHSGYFDFAESEFRNRLLQLLSE